MSEEEQLLHKEIYSKTALIRCIIWSRWWRMAALNLQHNMDRWKNTTIWLFSCGLLENMDMHDLVWTSRLILNQQAQCVSTGKQNKPQWFQCVYSAAWDFSSGNVLQMFNQHRHHKLTERTQCCSIISLMASTQTHLICWSLITCIAMATVLNQSSYF